MAPAWQAELVRELSSARVARPVIERYAASTGLTVQSLYRIARDRGWSSGRVRRMDAGALKCGLTDAQIETVVGYLHVTARDNKGPIMPVERAIQLAVDNWIIEPGQITPDGMNRILRERGLSVQCLKAPEPSCEMRSLHPNHVHVVDVSICIQYRMKNGRLGIMREAEFNKNKPHNYAKVNARLMRYVCVDHFSGAFYLHYYEAAGETMLNLFDFLCRTWEAKSDARLPMRGVPSIILMDNGSANISKPMRHVYERLGINIPPGTPHNPTRQGAVETMHNVIERWFETGLRMEPAYELATLNQWALDYFVHFQATRPHSRHGLTRSGLWLTITPEQLRNVPDMETLRYIFAYPEEPATVDNAYRVRVRGKRFDVRHVPGLYRGAKVAARVLPLEWPASIEVVYQDAAYRAARVETLSAELGAFAARAAVIGEEHKGVRKTEVRRAKDRIEEAAYAGQEGVKDADRVAFPGTKVFGIHADKLGPELAMIPKRGTGMDVDRADVSARMIPVLDLIKDVRAIAGAVSPELNAEIRARYAQTLTVAEAEAELASIKTTGALTPAAIDGEADGGTFAAAM
jgi:hypothetical protein